MPNVDNRTRHGDHPLPHKDNVMSEDVGRIADALTGLDEDVNAVDQRVTELAESDAAEDNILELPTDGPLSVGRGYYLPTGATVTMPGNPVEDDWVEFIPIGSADNFSANLTFAHPVSSLPAGTHQYNAYQRKTFTFHNGEWS